MKINSSDHAELYKYRDKVMSEVVKDIGSFLCNINTNMGGEVVGGEPSAADNISEYRVISKSFRNSLLCEFSLDVDEFFEPWFSDINSRSKFDFKLNSWRCGIRVKQKEENSLSGRNEGGFNINYDAKDPFWRSSNDRRYFSSNSYKNIISIPVFIMLLDEYGYFAEDPLIDVDTKVPSMINNLKSKLKDFRKSRDINYIVDLLMHDHNYLVEDMLAVDQESLLSVARMIGSYGKFLREDNRRVSIEVVYDDENSIVVKSEDKDCNYSKRYYLIGTDDTPDKFFIHRLRKTNIKDKSKENIRDILGFDEHYRSSSEVKHGVTYRVQGDLTMRREPYQEWRERLIELYKRQKLFIDFIPYDSSFRNYVSEKTGVYINDIPRIRRIGTGFRVENIETPEDNVLSKIENYIGTSREEIDKEKEYLSWLYNEDWKQISKRRKFICCLNILAREYMKENRVDNEINLDEAERLYTEEASERWETMNQVNLPADNHNIMLEKAIQDFVHHGYEKPNYNRDWIGVIIHDKSSMIIHHSEHNNIVENIPKGYYRFSFLDRHPLN